MCGRYYFDTKKDKLKVILTNAYKHQFYDFKEGEIFPSQMAPILYLNHHKIYAKFLRWGYQKKIINARAETVLERPLFKNDFIHRRCVIPISYFFEWDANKNKLAFGDEEYLAGFYNEQNEFIILTTESQGDLKPIHHRMPVCLEKHQIKDYLEDPNKALSFIQQPSIYPHKRVAN